MSNLAEHKLTDILEYLHTNWNEKVRANFLKDLNARIEQISSFPESCPKSVKYGGVYKSVVNKQIIFFYRVDFELEQIEIITIFDSRQDPDKLVNILR